MYIYMAFSHTVTVSCLLYTFHLPFIPCFLPSNLWSDLYWHIMYFLFREVGKNLVVPGGARVIDAQKKLVMPGNYTLILFEISVDNYFYHEMCTSICSLFLVRFCQVGHNYWWTIPLRLLVAWKLYRCISCAETTNTFEMTVYLLKF